MLYELLTGAKPYSADTVSALLYQHLHFPVPALAPAHAVFQPLLEALLAKNPRDRPRDGAEMASAMAKLWHRISH
jgi:serine/threonine-protein kinase PpkA